MDPQIQNQYQISACIQNQSKQQSQIYTILNTQQINEPLITNQPQKSQKFIFQQSKIQTPSNLILEITLLLKQKQYKLLSQKFFTLMNIQQNPQQKQVIQLGQQLINSWLDNPYQISLLQYFDYVFMETFNQQNRQFYWNIILKISQKIIQISIEAANKKDNIIQSNQINNSMSMINQNKKQKQVIDIWDIYLQLMRTYSYQSLQFGLTNHHWFIFQFIFCLTLQNVQINTKQLVSSSKSPTIITLLQKLSIICHTKYFLTHILQHIFHQLSLLTRIYITDLSKFMSTNNPIINITQHYPYTNNCTLLLKLIQYQFTNTQINISQNIKLDCLMMLMNIVEGDLKICANYNQVLEFGSQQMDGENIQNILNKNKKVNKMSELVFYCGQLLSVIFYRNFQWVLKFCRKHKKQQKQSQKQEQKQKSPQKTNKNMLKTLLKIYKLVILHTHKSIYKLQHENIVYKRLILGFCGMLRIKAMQSILQQCIIQLNNKIIKMIQAQYGWHQQQNDQYIPQQQPQQTQQSNDHQSQQILQKQQDKMLLNWNWNQQYYNKHKNITFQKIEEVDMFLESVWMIKNNSNQIIFQTIMNNFDEKQAVVWIAQLERFQSRRNDGDYDDQLD